MYSDIIQLAEHAGRLIMAVYQRDDFGIREKSDHSPVTEADLAANRLIIDELAKFTPDTPVLSEESADIPWSERRQWQRYWLVDPLDGTKEFIRRNDEFTVNIALVEGSEPVWGVVHAPALGLTYAGGPKSGKAKRSDTQGGDLTTLHATQPPSSDTGWRILSSRSHQSARFLEFLRNYPDAEVVPLGSSLKLCRIAEGEADLYPRHGATSEWDTAAGHAILLAAGGDIREMASGERLRYNQTESLINPEFIAGVFL